MILLEAEVRELLIWLIAVLVAVIVMGLGVGYYRRRWLGADDRSDAPWTLADLRKLRDGGEITAEEYEKMRAAMIGMVAGIGSERHSGVPDGLDRSLEDPDAKLENPSPP